VAKPQGAGHTVKGPAHDLPERQGRGTPRLGLAGEFFALLLLV
jgi:hypothetical protein